MSTCCKCIFIIPVQYSTAQHNKKLSYFLFGATVVTNIIVQTTRQDSADVILDVV